MLVTTTEEFLWETKALKLQVTFNNWHWKHWFCLSSPLSVSLLFFPEFSTNEFIYKEKGKLWWQHFHNTGASENIGLDWGVCSPARILQFLPVVYSARFQPECPGGWYPQPLLGPRGRHPSPPSSPRLWGGWPPAWLCQKAAWPPALLWSGQEENLGHSQLNYGLRNAGDWGLAG